MDISRYNYEEYFLDYAEGNLSAEEEEMLNNFLKFNPDLAEELSLFDLTKVVPEAVHLQDKNALKKLYPSYNEPVSHSNFDMYCVAFLENDLTREQRNLFEKYIQDNAKYQIELELFRRTYLPHQTVYFPLKNSIKKRRNPALFYLKRIIPVAAAASVAFLIFIRMEPLPFVHENVPPEETAVSKVSEAEPLTKSTVEKEKAVTIQVIKNSNVPVPVSGFKPAATEKKNMDNTASSVDQEDKGQMAGITIPKASLSLPDIENDKIYPVSQSLPTINMSSLAVADRLRYQIGKATDLMDNNDVFIWNLASQSVQEINKIAGTEMSLLAIKSQDGTVNGFQFKSRFISVLAPLSNE